MSDKIQIDATTERLFPGETKTVKVRIRFDKPTRVRGIRAEFHGAEKTEATYTTTSTDSKGKTQTKTQTATQYVDIVREKLLLQGSERKGFFARLLDSLATWFGGGQHTLVQPGELEFSVPVKIPEHAAASFKGKKCQIFYRLTVSVDLPIRVDWCESTEFEVVTEPRPPESIHPVHAVFPDENGRSFWEGIFGKSVALNLAVERNTMACGDSALGMLTVETPEPLKVDEIGLCLVGKESVSAHGHTDSHVHRHELGNVESPNLISSESVHEFPIAIPEFDGPWTQSGSNFEVSWMLEARLKVPWAKDPVIQVPIQLLPQPTESK